MSKVIKTSTSPKNTKAGMKKIRTVIKSRAAIGETVIKARHGKSTVIEKVPAGYTKTFSGLLIPRNLDQPVPASKLKTGFIKAKTEINSLIKEIASTMVESYSISEIELTASFSADGKFMGFGVGGAASIKIKIKPEGN